MRGISGAGASGGPQHSECEHYCQICVAGFTSATQLASHLCGSKHAKRVKMLHPGSEELKIAERLMAEHGSRGATPGSYSGSFSCIPCELSFNSQQQLEQHLNGGKHSTKLCELRGETPPVKDKKTKPTQPEGGTDGAEESNETKEPPTIYTCIVCVMQFNSEDQANAHLMGSRHKKRTGSIAAATSGYGPRAGFGMKRGNDGEDVPMACK